MSIKAYGGLVVTLLLVEIQGSYSLNTHNQAYLSADTDVKSPNEDASSGNNFQRDTEAPGEMKDAKIQQMTENQREKEDEENMKTTPTEMPQAPFALAFTFRDHKKSKNAIARFIQIKDNQFNYLLIPDTQKYCEGSSILLATNSARLGVTSLQTAEQLCNTSSECSFFSFAGAETKNDINPGSTWLCSGNEWLTAVPKSHWVTAVKPEYLQSLMPNYVLHVNNQVICDQRSRLGEARGATSPESASRTCDNDSRCSYFSMFFGGYSNNPSGPRGQIVYYCTGPPTNSAPAYGWIFAPRLKLTEESTDFNPDTGLPFGLPVTIKPIPGGSRDYRNNWGPITQDNYYDSQDKGVVIPPVKMA